MKQSTQERSNVLDGFPDMDAEIVSKKRKIEETTKPTENGNIYQVCQPFYVVHKGICFGNSINFEIAVDVS